MAETQAAEAEVEPEAKVAPEGLLDDIELPKQEEEVVDDVVDHIDKAKSGEKPDWLPDRFWDDDDGADFQGLAKSQQELYKKLRSGKHEAPKDGEYDLKFVGDRIADDDELMSKFKGMASERGLTQDDFESIVGMVLESIPEVKEEPEAKFDREEEIGKLGPKGKDILDGTVKWAESMVERGAWTSEDFDEFKVMAGTAAGVRALNRLRSHYGEKPIPVNSQPVPDGIKTQEELEAMVASEEYREKPEFRKQVAEDFRKKYGTDGSDPSVI